MKYYLNYRKLISISGRDCKVFLQNILSNDLYSLNEGNIQYSLLLTPQGKILFDFFIFKTSGIIFLDCHNNYIDEIKKKLTLYKLHSDVDIIDYEGDIFVTNKNFDKFCYLDPRNKNLGMRCYDFKSRQKNIITNYDDLKKYDEKRIKYLVPEFGIDFSPEEFYPLDLGMDNLNAISFNKGCYIGQEVTARMNYRRKKKKVLKIINLENYQINDKEVIDGDKIVGKILKKYNNKALALIKY